MKPERVVALTDGIFAIAMTLLAFQIQVPHIAAHVGSREFFHELAKVGPKLIVYAVSFIVLGIYWVAHHMEFAFIKKVNLRFIYMNIAFLLFIGLVPFSAALLGNYWYEQGAILVYGTNVAFCTLTLALMLEYSIHHDWMVSRTDIPAESRRRINRRLLGAPAFYILGIGASFIDTRISLVFFAIPPVFALLPARLRPRGERTEATRAAS